ncbi:MAG: hypothetical protein ACI4W2_00965 [Eubacterium sp.]
MSTKIFYLSHLELPDEKAEKIAKSLDGVYKIVTEMVQGKDMKSLPQKADDILCFNTESDIWMGQEGEFIPPK